eukprot:6174738-Pleurochrysis_carterae.AAC.1
MPHTKSDDLIFSDPAHRFGAGRPVKALERAFHDRGKFRSLAEALAARMLRRCGLKQRRACVRCLVEAKPRASAVHSRLSARSRVPQRSAY